MLRQSLVVAVWTIGILSGEALAETLSFACEGHMRSEMQQRASPLHFSLQIDSADHRLLAYTLWGTYGIPKPNAPVVGEFDEQSLMFMLLDDANSLVHGIALDSINGQFRHFYFKLDNGEPTGDPTLVVKGVCKKATPLF